MTVRHPFEVFMKFQDLGFPIEKISVFLGLCFAHDRDEEISRLFDEDDDEGMGNDVMSKKFSG